MQKFTVPDKDTIARMTVRSISSLLDTLKQQRAQTVEPYDTQIKFYEDLLEKKKEQANAKTTR